MASEDLANNLGRSIDERDTPSSYTLVNEKSIANSVLVDHDMKSLLIHAHMHSFLIIPEEFLLEMHLSQCYF
jgi:hypothetical protein